MNLLTLHFLIIPKTIVEMHKTHKTATKSCIKMSHNFCSKFSFILFTFSSSMPSRNTSQRSCWDSSTVNEYQWQMQTNKTATLLFLKINAYWPKYFAKLSVRGIQKKTKTINIILGLCRTSFIWFWMCSFRIALQHSSKFSLLLW
jgi:hypothetical protein